MNTRILLASNVSWSAYFRRPLIEHLDALGCEVHVVAGRDHYTERLESLPCTYHELDIRPRGKNIVGELKTVWSLRRIMRRVRPAVFLGFSVKPVIYGSIVSGRLGIPTVNNIPGLGDAFANNGLFSQIARMLYRYSQKRVHTIFFQNQESFDLFVDQNIIQPDQAKRLNGSGVDLGRFAYHPLPDRDGVTFVMIGRMIEKKGVFEYLQAAKQIKQRYPTTTFQLLGPAGDVDLGEIAQSEIKRWVEAGVVDYLGETDDVLPCIINADVVVLPTYYNEGVPRVLLESAAVGRPLIATDNVGCRDIVQDQHNGLLVLKQDVPALVQAMETMITMEYKERQAMGEQGRSLVEEQFSHQDMLDAYTTVIQEIINP